jgi:hypothetical protein
MATADFGSLNLSKPEKATTHGNATSKEAAIAGGTTDCSVPACGSFCFRFLLGFLPFTQVMLYCLLPKIQADLRPDDSFLLFA